MLVTARLARRGRTAAQALLGPWLVFCALMAASVAVTLALGGAIAPVVAVGSITAVSAVAAVVVIRATTAGWTEPDGDAEPLM
jgi:hypothetical protein